MYRVCALWNSTYFLRLVTCTCIYFVISVIKSLSTHLYFLHCKNLSAQYFFHSLSLLFSPRELAFQISEQFEALGASIGIKCGEGSLLAMYSHTLSCISSAVVVGGIDMMTQAIALARKPHVVIATPGRLVDHLENTKGFSLRSLRFLVMDEADRILNMDFETEVGICFLFVLCLFLIPYHISCFPSFSMFLTFMHSIMVLSLTKYWRSSHEREPHTYTLQLWLRKFKSSSVHHCAILSGWRCQQSELDKLFIKYWKSRCCDWSTECSTVHVITFQLIITSWLLWYLYTQVPDSW